MKALETFPFLSQVATDEEPGVHQQTICSDVAILVRPRHDISVLHSWHYSHKRQYSQPVPDKTRSLVAIADRETDRQTRVPWSNSPHHCKVWGAVAPECELFCTLEYGVTHNWAQMEEGPIAMACTGAETGPHNRHMQDKNGSGYTESRTHATEQEERPITMGYILV
jgi:hypothetical protein